MTSGTKIGGTPDMCSKQTDHSWVGAVLNDLETYANANGLPPELVGALETAASLAKGNLPIVYTDFVANQNSNG